MINPLVSVCIITYNHEKFIKQALDGILMQKINFIMEIIIADDCSFDNTSKILKEYKKKYPEMIKLILQKKNIGAVLNFKDLITRPNGKYIAYLEGDDYWTDPYKLQKQVDFLEGHPDYVLCFHNLIILDENTKKETVNYSDNIKDTSTLSDLFYANYINTPTALFRNVLKNNIPEWFFTLPIGDWALFVIIAQYGKIKYLKDVMATYRKHNDGLWTGTTAIKRITAIIQSYMAFKTHLNKDYEKEINYRLYVNYWKLTKRAVIAVNPILFIISFYNMLKFLIVGKFSLKQMRYWKSHNPWRK